MLVQSPDFTATLKLTTVAQKLDVNLPLHLHRCNSSSLSLSLQWDHLKRSHILKDEICPQKGTQQFKEMAHLYKAPTGLIFLV